MSLIGRVLLMAVCIFSSYALPNLAKSYQENAGDSNFLTELFAPQMRAMSTGEEECAKALSNRTVKTNNQLTNATNACFENANQTLWNNDQNANASIKTIRYNLHELEQSVHNCSAMNDSVQLTNCVTNSFERNLRLLDSTNAESLKMIGELDINQTQVESARRTCINTAVTNSKSQSMKDQNEYHRCVENVRTVKEKPQQIPQNLNKTNKI